MKKIIKNPMSLAGLIIILIIGVLAIFAGYPGASYVTGQSLIVDGGNSLAEERH